MTRWLRFIDLRALLYTVAILLSIAPAFWMDHGTGRAAAATSGPPTDFAALVPRLAYGFAPWSPLLPFVFVRPRRPTHTRVALVILAIVAVGIDLSLHRVLFAPVGLAAVVGAALADLDARPQLPMALIVGVVGFLVIRDLAKAPHLALTAVTALGAGVLAIRPRWMPITVVVALALRVVEIGR